jgi:vacuolar-type H+-ATPase subunit F/Vma7
MATIKRKAKGASHNPALSDVLAEAQKEKVIPLHVQLPESLMKKLRLFAVQNDKSLREVVMRAIEKEMK